MDIGAVNTLSAAFLAGGVTSLHCVGMCGPLACAAMGKAGDGSAQLSSTLYHVGRLISYSIVGMLAGAIGQAPLSFLSESPAVWFPWVLVGVFLLVATGLDKRIPRPAFAARWLLRVRTKFDSMRGVPRPLIFGLGTPLLPCGPLYLMFGIALVSGSAVRGAEFCLAFGLGTIPLLWLAQTQFGVLQRRLGPQSMRRLQRGGALAVAMLMAWRLRGTLWFVEGCPNCH